MKSVYKGPQVFAHYLTTTVQCNDLPSYWIRQVRHTDANNPDALTERKSERKKETNKRINCKNKSKRSCRALPGGGVTYKTK